MRESTIKYRWKIERQKGRVFLWASQEALIGVRSEDTTDSVLGALRAACWFPGIMSPRGTPVADEYGYPSQEAGKKTVNPRLRKVLPSDINKIGIPASGNGNVVKAKNKIFLKNGKFRK